MQLSNKLQHKIDFDATQLKTPKTKSQSAIKRQLETD